MATDDSPNTVSASPDHRQCRSPIRRRTIGWPNIFTTKLLQTWSSAVAHLSAGARKARRNEHACHGAAGHTSTPRSVNRYAATDRVALDSCYLDILPHHRRNRPRCRRADWPPIVAGEKWDCGPISLQAAGGTGRSPARKRPADHVRWCESLRAFVVGGDVDVASLMMLMRAFVVEYRRSNAVTPPSALTRSSSTSQMTNYRSSQARSMLAGSLVSPLSRSIGVALDPLSSGSQTFDR